MNLPIAAEDRSYLLAVAGGSEAHLLIEAYFAHFKFVAGRGAHSFHDLSAFYTARVQPKRGLGCWPSSAY